jgi:hypothetical protein
MVSADVFNAPEILFNLSIRVPFVSLAQAYCFWPGGITPVARSGKDCVSVALAEPLSSADPVQSPAHSLVPLTIPTSLQPIGSFGFTWTSGLLPIFGDASSANADAEEQIATKTSKARIVTSPSPSAPGVLAVNHRFAEQLSALEISRSPAACRDGSARVEACERLLIA